MSNKMPDYIAGTSRRDAHTRAWYVIHNKPHKDKQVCCYLEYRGFEVFFPTVKVKPVTPRASKIRPYFPGYLFVHADPGEVGTSELQWIPGAVGVVSFYGQPGIVPESVIYELKQHIKTIEAAGGLMPDSLQQGDPVRITQGPFTGCEAIFDLRLNSAERVQVLLELLGRQTRLHINATWIEKVQGR